jgi:hypothetical protein
VQWTDDKGAFHVMANWADRPTSQTEVVVGKFEGVSDAPYTGPTVSQLLDSSTDKSTAPADTKGKEIGKKKTVDSEKKTTSESTKKSETSKSGAKSSKTKKPSRSD